MLLKVSGLTKHFSGLSAVQELEFSVKEGEIVGLIGPNGAGKKLSMPTWGDKHCLKSGG